MDHEAEWFGLQPLATEGATMPKSATLKYLGLASGLSDGSSPRLELGTPSGQVREVPLDRRALVQIIKGAAQALEHLDRMENRP